MNYEEYDIGYIPPNFKEGVSVLGFMIRIPYILQATPVVALVVMILFLLGDRIGALIKIVAGAAVCMPVIILAAAGLNGDSLFGYLRTVAKFWKQNRLYLYNPRVKNEIRPLEEDPGSVQMLPREKILLYMEKRRTGKEDKTDCGMDRYEELFFEEDEGLAEKPYAYMNRKERMAYNRNKHKRLQ